MGPKKKTKSARSTKDDNKTADPWVQELIGRTINEDSWRCNVSIMFESNPSVTFYNKLLATYCADKSSIFRNNLKVISYADFKQSIIFDQAVESADPSKVKPYNKLCTHLNGIMQHGDRDHFVRLLASFLKYKILDLKEQSIRRHQLMEEFKHREKVDEENNRNIIEECLSKANGNDKHQQQLKTKKKTGSKNVSRKDGRKTAANKRETRKFTTTLKRGEEFLNEIYIEDEPEDGPQMYVVLTGFLEPDLPLQLLALGVPLVGVLKLTEASLTNSVVVSSSDEQTEIIEQLKLDEHLFYSNSHDKTSNNLYQDFWRDFYVLLISHKNDEKFENVIFYPFSVILSREDHHSNIDNIMASLSKQVYDHVTQVQYNLSDIINDRLVYLGNLKQMPHVEDHISKDSIDTSEYNRLLNSIPPDCVEVYHILEAILQQITKTTIQRNRIEVEQFSPRGTDDDLNNNSIISSDLELSRIGCHISRLEEIYDLAPKHDLKTLGKIDEPGVVFDFEDKLEISMSRHKEDRNPNFEDDAIKLLENYWRKRLSIDDCSGKNQMEAAGNESINTHKTFNSCSISSDLNEQTDKLIKIQFSDDSRGSRSESASSKFSRANLQYYNTYNYVMDENVFEKLCIIPCGHKNVLLEDKKKIFCFDALDFHHNNEEDLSAIDNCNSKNDGTNCGQFCYSEMRPKPLVQNLFESIGDHACFDIETINELGLHYVKFHKLCCLPEKNLVGSLRTAVCLRDFFDYIVPEIAASQIGMATLESSIDNKIIEIDNNNQHNKSDVDHWCLDKDFMDSNSLKSSLPVGKNTFPNDHKTLVETSDQVDFVANDEITQFDNCNNKTWLDAFELGSSRFFNFTDKTKQFRFSETFTTQIRILSNSCINNDFILIEQSICDYTLYFYVGLRQKVDNDVKFHLRHRSGMIVYFERAAVKNRDSGLSENPAQPGVDMKRKSKSISDSGFTTETVNSKQHQQQLSYRFSLSWPSCMHLDLFNGNLLCPAYIRQWYSAPHKHTELVNEEEMRCYTQNGEILKFMKDKSVIVYYPNGRIGLYHHTLTRYSSASFRNSNNVDLNSQKTTTVNDESSEYDYIGGVLNLIQGSYKYEQTSQDVTNGTLRSELSNGVVVTLTYNGERVVDFPDGSRITSLLDCEVQVAVDGDMIFEKYSSSNNENEFTINDSADEEFVLISAHYLIEHECFASVLFRNFENKIKVVLPHSLSISIDSKNDCLVVNLNDENRIEIENSEINLFNGSSICSTILLSNIQEYSNTFPQFERYEFFNCKVDSKCVLLLDSWGDTSTDHLYFCGNYSSELDNMYYVVRSDLSGYKIYPSDFETELNQLTGNKQRCVRNESVNSVHKSALFIQPLEACEWKMKMEPLNTFERLQSTIDCCRFSWLNPIFNIHNKTSSISIDDNPRLLTIGLLQWFKSEEQFVQIKSAAIRNKNIYYSILKDNDYRAAMEIYNNGNRIFVSERQQVIDQAKTIVSETLKKVQSIFSSNEKLKKINNYKQLLKHDGYCKYFNTKVGMSFSLADEIVTYAIKRVEPREIGKMISSSVTEELIKNAIEIAELQAI